MDIELVLSGGTVVTPDGANVLDVGISDGTIVALSLPGQLRASGRHVDVSGKIIVPGGIDPHIHCNSQFAKPDFLERLPPHVPRTTASASVVSRAALYGGTTTLLDFVRFDHETGLDDSLQQQLEHWSGHSFTNFSYHVVVAGELPDQALPAVPRFLEGGFQSIKVYTTNVIIGGAGRRIDFGTLWDLMHLTKEHGGVIAVHSEDDDMVMHQYRRLFAQGRHHFRHMPEVHSVESEDLSFRRVIRMSELAAGAPVYFMHVSAAFGVEAIAEAQTKGLPVYGEALPQYALHTAADYDEPDGMKYHTYPSLKSQKDSESLWTGLRSGAIATFATDELCTDYEVKIFGDRIDDVVGGNTGVEPRLSLVYTEMVKRRGLSLTRFVDATSANAARLFGMYPKKGAIAVGSDADIAVLDEAASRTLRAVDLHESDYSPWEGWQVDAWPVLVLLGGRIVVEDGALVDVKPRGALVSRQPTSSETILDTVR